MKWGSTNVYAEDADGNAVYDWRATDEILDAFAAAGVRPLVELGFMPEALSSHPAPYRNSSLLQLNGGCFYPPKDYSRWSDLVQAWARHAGERFPNEADGWLWELWNEPDSAYWHGTFDEFAKLYDFSEAGLHSALPEARLGGPAVIYPDRPFFAQFLEHCVSGSNAVSGGQGTRLDWVSFHAKGGVSLAEGHVQLNLGQQLRLHRAGFETVASFPELRRTPIYITEADPDGCAACPTALIEGAEYRTSPAYGAYEMAMMKRSLELQDAVGVQLDGVLTWAFTFPGTSLFAGYRELRTNGIDLPVLSAFRLLGQLEGDRLPLTSSGARPLSDILEHGVRNAADVDGLAAASARTVRVLLWNYHDDVTSAPPAALRLALALPTSFGTRARVSHLRVDESHGNAHALWLAQGSPEQPTPEQLAALREAMLPAQLGSEEALNVAPDGSLELELELPRFGVSLLQLQPAE